MHKSPKTVSLRQQLLVWLLLPLLFLWLIGAVIAYHVAVKFSNIAYDRSLADFTRDISQQITVADGRLGLDLPRAAVEMLLADEYDKIYFKVSDLSGRLIAGEPGLPMPDTPVTFGSPIMQYGTVRGHRLRIASRYFDISGQTVLVQIAETLNKQAILQREIITAMVLPQVVLTLIAATIVWLGVTRGLKPLDHMRDEIASRSYRDLTPIEESHSPSEMLPVARSVNDLLKRLDAAMQLHRRFINDAAHQLRTPLAGLKAQLDIALQEPEPERMRHSLHQIRGSVSRSSRLIKQMMALAQVEPGSDAFYDLKELDLNMFSREITNEWVPEALRKNIDLGFSCPDGKAMIYGDALRLKMMIDNILDNALRYSLPGGIVTLRLELQCDNICLIIEDNGPGIPEEERGLVFERFYRVQGSGVDGSGLGLAIAREIAIVHDARILVDTPKEGNGTAVRVIFPSMRHQELNNA